MKLPSQQLTLLDVKPTKKQFNADLIPQHLRLTEELMVILLGVPALSIDIESSNADFSNVIDTRFKEYFEGSLGLAYPTKLILLTMWCEEIPQGIAMSHQDILDNLDFMKQLFSTKTIRFLGHNIVFDLRILGGHYGLPIPPRIWDTMTIEILFADADPGAKDDATTKRLGLKDLVKHYKLLDTIIPKKVLPICYDLLESCLQALDKKVRGEMDIPLHAKIKDIDPSRYLSIYGRFKSLSRKNLDDKPVEQTVSYAILDVIFTYYLFKRQANRIRTEEKHGYTHLTKLCEWETRFSRVCAAMAIRGTYINKPLLEQRLKEWYSVSNNAIQEMSRLSELWLRDYFNEQLTKSEIPVYAEHYDWVFDNYRIHPSWHTDETRHYLEIYKQLTLQGFDPNRDIFADFYLYQVCQLIPVKKRPATMNFFTATGGYAFTKDTLPHYVAKYPLVKHYQVWMKEKGHIGKAEEYLAHAAMDGRIHPTIVSRAVTGRTSSSTPNTQNADVKDHDKKEEDMRFLGIMSAEDGWLAMGEDIESAEIYASAIIARDNAQLQAALAGDFHGYAAKYYFSNRYNHALGTKEGSNKELRKLAKNVNFGTAYEMGAAKLIRNYADIRDIMTPNGYEFEEIMCNEKFINWATNERVKLLPVDFNEASEEDWWFAATAWNAKKLLATKDETFPDVYAAKAVAREEAERFGYSLLWSGRRCYIRKYFRTKPGVVRKKGTKLKAEDIERDAAGQAILDKEVKNGWNNKCQGGVGEVTRRWSVLVLEAFEAHPELQAYITNYVHDEIVFECPIENHEIVCRIVTNIFYTVFDTFPPDEEGRHWFDRTTPRAIMKAGVNHADNASKWGYHPTREYPVDQSLVIETPDEEWVENYFKERTIA